MLPVPHRFLLRSATAIAACATLFATACGDTDDPSATGASGPTGTAATSSSTGTGGAGGEGGGGGASGGSGGAAPTTCRDIQAAMSAWVAAHQSCGADLGCVRLDLPENAAICNAVAAPGGDADGLTALVDAWIAADCDGGGICSFTPGEAVCDDGSCKLVIDTSCEECSAELDPQCTVGNQNAINMCFAENCLKEAVAYPGFCADSAECALASGTCEETYFNDPPCPDGTRWDVPDPEHACAGGNLRNTCCIPWDQPCSFIVSSMTLSLDPFTCATPTGNGQPWTCMHVLDQQSCTTTGTIEQPLGAVYNATATVVATNGNLVTVEGLHHDTGRTFTCQGEVSYDPFDLEVWSCTACDGAACTSCNVQQTGYCNL